VYEWHTYRCRSHDCGVRNLAQLASRLFLSVWMAMGNGLNEENEGDNGQGNTHRPDQTLLR
jgi:hypothetical protein